MSDSDGTNYYDDGDHKAAVFSGAVLVAAVVFFFITVFFVVFMYIYARWRWGPGSLGRADADHNHSENTTANRTRGLDPKVRKSLPVIVFESKDFKGGLECAVCLSEVVDGEKARLLPNCKHGFHLDCIDMWFRSHSTCPLCRNPAGTQLELGPDSAPEAISADGSSPESIGLPTNVLFWGTGAGRVQETNTCPATTTFSSSTPSSSSSDGKLVIEIPRRVMEGFSSTTDGANSKTPTPTSTRLRSFRRLFSRGKRADLGCSSPGTVAFDVEQGRTDAGAITTPKTTSD